MTRIQSEPLSDEELEQLEELLVSDDVPADCMNLEMLDGYLAAIGQTGDHIVGDGLALLRKVNGYLGVQMSARFLERVNVNAGAKVDDLYAVLVALDYAGNEVGAVYG